MALADAMNANMDGWETIFEDEAYGGGGRLQGLRPIGEIMSVGMPAQPSHASVMMDS